jgi:menaquinol-cytochrome c reductase iron-sulfur subunit
MQNPSLNRVIARGCKHAYSFHSCMQASNAKEIAEPAAKCGCAKPLPGTAGRRGFLKKFAAVAIGAAAIIAPIGAALSVLLDPLRRRASGSNFVRVASLSAVPSDGLPRKFAIVADRTDAWNKFPQTPIGAVYLRRTGEKTIEALNVVCPHAGGFVDYNAQEKCFLCPLHNSAFGLDGSIKDPKSPSPRSMDSLKVEIRDGEIWVAFQNFRAGTRDKIPA